MKKLLVILSCTATLAFVSCGPSEEEREKQKKIDDSLFEKDRNNAIDNANKILMDTAIGGNDSMAKKDEKKAK